MRVFVVVNSKGGVGKSFVAQNVLVPVLMEEYGEVSYIDYDTLNAEAGSLKNERKIKVLKVRAGELPELGSEATVIDSGGNLTTLNVLDELAKYGFQELDTTVVIPVGKRLVEINEALKTYKRGKSLGFKRFLFAINGVIEIERAEEEFFIWFSGVKPTNFTPAREYVEEEDRNEIFVPYERSGILSYIKDVELRFPYSYYLDNKHFFDEVGELINRAFKEGRKDKVSELMQRRKFLSFQREFFEEVKNYGKEKILGRTLTGD